MTDVTGPPPVRRGPPPWWFFAVIGVAAVAAVAVFFLGRGRDSSAPEAAPSPWALPEGANATPTVGDAPSSPDTWAGSEQASPSSPTADPLGASCSNARGGYGIDYPAGWSVPTDPAWKCQLFDPQPIALQPDTEVPVVAVTVYTEDYRMSKVLAALTDPNFQQVLSMEPGTFSDASLGGTVIETRSTGDGYWPKGTRTYTVLVDLGVSTLGVTTNDLAGDYEQNKETVDTMAQSLRLGG